MEPTNGRLANSSNADRVAMFEQIFEDVVEISGMFHLSFKLEEAERRSGQAMNAIDKIRQGIVLHEAAAKSKLLINPRVRVFSLRSYHIFTDLSFGSVALEARPMISAYRASSLAHYGLEAGELKEVKMALSLFNESVRNYGSVSLMPEFLRGKIAKKLPWYFFRKKRSARIDFGSIIKKEHLVSNSQILNRRILSFCFFELAGLLRSRGPRRLIIEYLNKAIVSDPNLLAAGEEAAKFRSELLKKDGPKS